MKRLSTSGKKSCRILLLVLFLISTGGNGMAAGPAVDQTRGTSETGDIDLRDPRIAIRGSMYTLRTSDTIYFQRFSDHVLSLTQLESKLNPVRAHTTSGIVVSFKTSSPAVTLTFTVEEGENRGHKYAAYQDGQLSGEYAFSKTDGPDLRFTVQSTKPGDEVLYEITMPNWSITSLTKLALDEGYSLAAMEGEARPVYVAYGNSITHGTGQNGTHKTYPFLLAKQYDLDLYNLAVGGAKTSQEVSEMLADDFDRIDYMTMLIGYNDYNGEGISTEEYHNRYLAFLRTFREKHPHTVIYCLTLTYTTTNVSSKTGIPANSFRQTVIDIVDLLKSEGDDNIFLLHGDSISSELNLNDAVHFSETGAELFAGELSLEMEKKSPGLAIDEHTPIRSLVSAQFPSGNLHIGSACHEDLLGTQTETILDREFGYVTPANDFKQSYIHPEPGVWRWSRSDTWVAHCRENEQVIRLHAPISPQCSKWVKEDYRTPEELEQMLEEYVTGLCQRYNDHSHILWLDVVNEILNTDGSWFGPKTGTDSWENPWPLIGYDESTELRPPLYIKQAFEFANMHAPDMKLIINQHGRFEQAVWDKMKEVVLYLRELGLRVDGVGWQAHVDLGWEKDTANMTRLSAFIDWCHLNQLEFHITEFNIWLREGNEGRYGDQAASFYEIVKLVASKHTGGVVGINFWHIRGVETANPDRDGCLWASDFQPKPAYFDVKRALEEIAGGMGPRLPFIAMQEVVVNNPFEFQLQPRGVIGRATYTIDTDAKWLGIDQNGKLSGTPTSAGTYLVGVSVKDDLGTTSLEFMLVVLKKALGITSDPVTTARVGVPYSYQLEFIGQGSFSLQTYMSQNWLSIDQNGLLSGTPVTPGTIPVIVILSNDLDSVQQEFELVIQEALGISSKPGSKVAIFPNPASEKLYIHGFPAGTELTLVKLNGAQILQETSTSETEALDISALPKDTYILKAASTRHSHAVLVRVQ